MATPAPIPSCRDSQVTLSSTALHKELGNTFSLCMTISYLRERKRVKVNARIKKGVRTKSWTLAHCD